MNDVAQSHEEANATIVHLIATGAVRLRGRLAHARAGAEGWHASAALPERGIAS